MIDTKDFEKRLVELLEQRLNEMLDDTAVAFQIRNKIEEQIDSKVNATLTGTINKLVDEDKIVNSVVGSIEQKIAATVDRLVEQRVTQKVSGAVAQANVGEVLKERLDEYLATQLSSKAMSGLVSANAIDWDNFKMSMNLLEGGQIENFSSSGIEDVAKNVELTVMDGQVVVENQVVTREIRVLGESELNNTNVKGNLHVSGNVSFGNESFKKQVDSLIDNKIGEYDQKRGNDLYGKDLLSNGQLLISNKSIGPSVTDSNLRSVGRLRDLFVVGETNLSETLFTDSGRVGINTENPAGVLSVWDDDAELTIKKNRKREMFIGSTRDSRIALGVNGDTIIAISRDGVEVPSVTVGGVKLSTSKEVPSGRGTPGEIVIMLSNDPSHPWAYQCLGGAEWTPLSR